MSTMQRWNRRGTAKKLGLSLSMLLGLQVASCNVLEVSGGQGRGSGVFDKADDPFRQDPMDVAKNYDLAIPLEQSPGYDPATGKAEFDFCAHTEPGQLNLKNAAWLAFMAANEYSHFACLAPVLSWLSFGAPTLVPTEDDPEILEPEVGFEGFYWAQCARDLLVLRELEERNELDPNADPDDITSGDSIAQWGQCARGFYQAKYASQDKDYQVATGWVFEENGPESSEYCVLQSIRDCWKQTRLDEEHGGFAKASDKWSSSLTWTFKIPDSKPAELAPDDVYLVQAWWPKFDKPYSAQAVYEIQHAEGTLRRVISQESKRANWKPLALVKFVPNQTYTIQLYSDTTDSVFADAIRIVRGDKPISYAAAFEKYLVQEMELPDAENYNSANYIQFISGGRYEAGGVRFEAGSTQAMFARHLEKNVVIISFRGTEIGGDQTLKDVFTDLAAWDTSISDRVYKANGEAAKDGEALTEAEIDRSLMWPEGWGRVHYGFLKAFESIQIQIRQKLEELEGTNAQIWITGHSLGGALAHMLAARIMAYTERGESYNLKGLYTFGSPRVGNDDFKDKIEGLLEAKGVTVMRFRNHNDLVTRIPIWWPADQYHHIGQMVYLGDEGELELPDTEWWRAAIPPSGKDHKMNNYYDKIMALLSSPDYETHKQCGGACFPEEDQCGGDTHRRMCLSDDAEVSRWGDWEACGEDQVCFAGFCQKRW